MSKLKLEHYASWEKNCRILIESNSAMNICTATPEQESADRFSDLREISLLRKMKQTLAPSLIEYLSYVKHILQHSSPSAALNDTEEQWSDNNWI